MEDAAKRVYIAPTLEIPDSPELRNSPEGHVMQMSPLAPPSSPIQVELPKRESGVGSDIN